MNLEARSDLLVQHTNDPLYMGAHASYESVSWTNHTKEEISNNSQREISNDSQISQIKFADLKIMDNPVQDYYSADISTASSQSKEDEMYTDISCSSEIPLDKDPGETGAAGIDKITPEGCPGKKTDELPFKCAICEKRFSTKITIRLHMLKRHRVKSQFTCELCGIKVDSPAELVKHINSEHKSIDDRYYCKKCNFNTTNYYDISSHTHEIHTCSDCGKTFKFLDKFESHKLTHSGEQVKKQEKNFTCDACGKRFAFGCLLRDHINLHTGAKPYLCPICGRSFSQKASLKQHARIHNSVRPHKCSECDQGFYGKGDLKKHLRKHTGERPYVCEMCGDGFSQSSHLGFHKRTHTGERPYPCDICGRGFTKKGDVVRHRRIHTGELPYLCQVCGKAFRQNTQCANHIKNHHPNSLVPVIPNPTPISTVPNYLPS